MCFFVGYFVFVVVTCLLLVVRCLLSFGCWLLGGCRCLLLVVGCWWFDVCRCLSLVARCVLRVVG